MKTRSVLAALVTAAPLALLGQAPAPAPADTTRAEPAKVTPKKPYVPHKAPLKDAPRKSPAAPKKPAPPKPPAQPTAPTKPIDVPWVVYDRKGNPIPTNPDAYDLGAAKKK